MHWDSNPNEQVLPRAAAITTIHKLWLPRLESNQHSKVNSFASYRWTTGEYAEWIPQVKLNALLLVVKHFSPTWTTILHTKHTSDCTIYAHSLPPFRLRKGAYVLFNSFIYLLLNFKRWRPRLDLHQQWRSSWPLLWGFNYRGIWWSQRESNSYWKGENLLS